MIRVFSCCDDLLGLQMIRISEFSFCSRVYNLHVQTGRRKHLAARRDEDLGGRESGNPPSLQVRRPHLRAKEKSSEYHVIH